MATPLTADQQLAAYKSAGISKIVENAGWRTRGIWRIAAKGWSPRGVIIHQTAGNLGPRSVQQYMDDIINGDPAIPDKANVVVAPDGTLWINAAGRANHCLQYSGKGLAAITNETMPLNVKYCDYRGSQENMNLYCYGVEMIATAPNSAQIETAARWAASICRAHGWSAGAVAGHGEMASDRDYSDPGIDMGEFRTRVAALLNQNTTTGGLSMADVDKLYAVEVENQKRITLAKDSAARAVAITTENQKRINHVQDIVTENQSRITHTRDELAALAADVAALKAKEQA